jgi:hypothetical protein
MLADLEIEEMQKGRDDLSGDGSQIDLDNMFQGNLTPLTHYGTDNKTITKRHSNIEKIRKSSRLSSRSDLGAGQNMEGQQFKTLKEFLNDMFTDQFVNYTNEIKRVNLASNAYADPQLQARFQKNEEFLFMKNDPLQFPKDFRERYPF